MDLRKRGATDEDEGASVPPRELVRDEGGDAGGGDAGGGSAAEAAVTSGGASQPAEAASGTTESNPVVTLVRAGVSWESAKVVKIAEIVTQGQNSVQILVQKNEGNFGMISSAIKHDAALKSARFQ